MKFSEFMYCIYSHPTACLECGIFWALVCVKNLKIPSVSDAFQMHQSSTYSFRSCPADSLDVLLSGDTDDFWYSRGMSAVQCMDASPDAPEIPDMLCVCTVSAGVFVWAISHTNCKHTKIHQIRAINSLAFF